MATKSSFDGADGNWRETKTAQQCLSHLCLSEHLSDISFVFKGNGDVKLPAHKFVLSMRSPVFEAMFYGTLAEEGRTISIEDIEPETMKDVLRFVYSDEPELNGNNVLQCLYGAKKYALTGLVNQCSSFLENNIDTSNVCLIHEQAVFYEMKPLQTKCSDYILQHASDIFLTQGFLQASHATLLDLLKHDELSVDEVDVFKAAVRWSKGNCEAKQLSLDARNIRECLGDALFEIRFPVMAIEDFAHVVTPTGVLSSEEQIMLYQFNATKGSSKMSKFSQRERSVTTFTIDVTKYARNQSRGSSSGFRLKIQSQPKGPYSKASSMHTNKTPLLVKSVTGSFIRNIKRITTVYGDSRNYKMTGDKITFQKPIDVCKGITIIFHHRNSENPYDSDNDDDDIFDSRSYRMNIQENVDGRPISIVEIPVGMETISFAKCKDN